MMSQFLETERERAVWERVLSAREPRQEQEPPCPEPPDCECPETPDCTVTPDQLLEWACDECHDASLYRHLARCLPNSARRWLLEIANDEQCHAKRLAAHYFTMTGCRAQLHAHFVPSHTPRELLRQRYQAELDGSAQYRDAAQCAEGELRCLLDQLSRDEARHSRMVMCLLECVI